MKKHGFTLIETLISIIIFGIILNSVLSSYAFSFRLFNNCDSNTYIELYAKTILSNYKQKDNSYIKKLYDNGVKNEKGLTGYFINFDDLNELSTGLNEASFNKSISSGSFSELRLQNTCKKFAAFCGINKSKNASLGFEVYTLIIRVSEKNSILNGVENERDFVFIE